MTQKQQILSIKQPKIYYYDHIRKLLNFYIHKLRDLLMSYVNNQKTQDDFNNDTDYNDGVEDEEPCMFIIKMIDTDSLIVEKNVEEDNLYKQNKKQAEDDDEYLIAQMDQCKKKVKI